MLQDTSGLSGEQHRNSLFEIWCLNTRIWRHGEEKEEGSESQGCSRGLKPTESGERDMNAEGGGGKWCFLPLTAWEEEGLKPAGAWP